MLKRNIEPALGITGHFQTIRVASLALHCLAGDRNLLQNTSLVHKLKICKVNTPKHIMILTMFEVIFSSE